MATKNRIILFDGVCNLCNRGVVYILKRDKDRLFRFSPLQSEQGSALIQNHPELPEHLDSIVYLENNRAYYKSDAVLRILCQLGRMNRLIARAGRLFPKSFRDKIYDFIARNRYGWFGKRKSCMVPEEKIADRFL
jgi:predicted DCC family thiol-disulfide oxidoreductase YuxK